MNGNELREISDRLYKEWDVTKEHYIITDATFENGQWRLIVAAEKKEQENENDK